MERPRQSRGKHRKQIVPSIDRLSDLPDAILCHILSFLPTKISVATNVLARRWRFLWTHIPNLDFSSYDFEGENDDSETSISDIIHRVMSLYKAKNMDTFRLRDIHCNKYQLKTWVTIAIERNVRNIDLYRTVMLPRCLFTCKTLVDLRLHSCEGIPSTGTISLPSLKKLHLSLVQYQNDDALPHVLSGCPVLEELLIKGINHQVLRYYNIFSPTIKRLTIDIKYDSYDDYDDDYDNPDCGVKINTPALRYLQVDDCPYEYISLSPMTSLVEADIRIFKFKEEGYYICDVVKFLDCLSNVKCLKISGYFDEGEFIDIAVAGSGLRFDDLIKLEVVADWRFLIKFLESTNNLEVLIVDVDPTYWMEPEQVPTCLLSHLKIVRIDLVECIEQQFNMVRYLLRNAKVLERMEIYFIFIYGIGKKAKLDAVKRISLFQRGSEACELVFH